MKLKACGLLLLLIGMMATRVAIGREILGHISDETESPTPPTETPIIDDRRIIYRVICTPGGETLPDCESPVSDTESAAKSVNKRQRAEVPLDDENKNAAPATRKLAVNKKSTSTTKKSSKKAQKPKQSSKKKKSKSSKQSTRKRSSKNARKVRK